MNGPLDDKAFEEYLKRGSPVSQHYQALDADEVPSELDRAILGRAEEAVRAEGVAKHRRWRRWSVPVALAASTVLAVSIVLESGQHEQALTRAPTYPVTTQAEPARAPVDLQAESATGTDVAAPVGAASSDIDEREEAAARHDIESSVIRERAERRAQAAAPVSGRAAAPAATEAREQEMAIAQERTEDERQLRMRSAAPQPAPASPAQASRSEQSQAVGDAAFMGEAKKASVPRDPQQWLRAIRELRQAGKTEEANREWKAFREAYPDYAVAEDDPAIGG